MKNELNFAKLLALYGAPSNLMLKVGKNSVEVSGAGAPTAKFDKIDPKLGATNGTWKLKVISEKDGDVELVLVKGEEAPKPKKTSAEGQQRSSCTHLRTI